MTNRPYLLPSALSERIYHAIRESSVGCVRLWQRGELREESRRNPYRFLLTPQGERLLSLADASHRFPSKSASDFENLRDLLSYLPSTIGSGYYSYVRLLLEHCFEIYGEPHPENAATIWKTSLSRLPNMEDASFSSYFKLLQKGDIREWILPSAEVLSHYESLEMYIGAFEVFIDSSDMLTADLSNIAFVSPDPYHAQKSFEAIRKGCADEDAQNILASQILRVTGERAQKHNVPLLLCGDLSIESAETFWKYLQKHNRLPRLLYGMPFDDSDRIEERYHILESSGLLGVLSGIIPIHLPYASVAELLRSLHIIAKQYPIGRLILLTEEGSISEAYVGAERFLRLLSSFLAEAVTSEDISEETAITLGRKIFCENGSRLFS